ncbi:hypothetical protein Anas_10906, partial [Armadillidium nasatum]
DESDIRLKKTKEVIGFIKCLKAMALEEVFIKKISDVREKEMHFLLIEGILKALLIANYGKKNSNSRPGFQLQADAENRPSFECVLIELNVRIKKLSSSE